MKSRTVLVTGAAGGVGRTICGALMDSQIHVRGLVLPQDAIEDLPLDKKNLVTGSIEDPEVVSQAMAGVDAVVNCAALLPNALHLAPDAFRRVNVDGALNVLREAARRNVRKAIFFSTISVVDHNTRRIAFSDIQDYVTNSHDAYLESKISLEKALKKEAAAFNGQISVIRPAFIYGPGNFSVWQDALKLVQQGKMRIIGSGDVALPLIYVGDIAAFVLLLLDRVEDNPAFDIHVLASHEPTTMRQVFCFIANYLGAKPPRHVPYLPLSLAASVADLLPDKLRIGRLKLLTTARVRQYSRGYDLSGVLHPAPLGFVPPTSYEIGMPKMLDDYRRHRSGTGR